MYVVLHSDLCVMLCLCMCIAVKSSLTNAEMEYALQFWGSLPISIGINSPAAGKGVGSFVNRIVRNAGIDDDISDDHRTPNCVLGYNRLAGGVYYLRASKDIKPGQVLVTMYGSGGHRYG